MLLSWSICPTTLLAEHSGKLGLGMIEVIGEQRTLICEDHWLAITITH